MSKSRNVNDAAGLGLDKHVRIQVGGEGSEPESKVKVTLLWQDLSSLSKTSQFILCCVGIFVFYLLYGFLLELIFTLDGLKPYSWFITLMQFGYYSVFGLTFGSLAGSIPAVTASTDPDDFQTKQLKIPNWIFGFRIPIKTYLLLAGLTLGTVGFSNTSLQHLNYPTQVIFKCCKLIPVMIGGILIQRKTYGPLDFLAAASMCTGLAWFTLADSYTSPNFNTLGVIMVSLALMCDAVIGNVQEKAMNAFNASNSEVVLYSYSFGFLYLFILLVSTGKFFNAFYFSLNNPVQTYGYGLLFSAAGYLGVQIVLTLVRTCGALAAATVTTCRKAVSIVLSFVFFSKPFTFGYFWSGLLVLLGIYLNVYAKRNRDASLKDLAARCFPGGRIKMRRKFSEKSFSV